MSVPFVFQLFLYFPEDKSEYLPASITMAVFIIAAIITWRAIIKLSKKEEQQAKQLEENLRVHDKDEQ